MGRWHIRHSALSERYTSVSTVLRVMKVARAVVESGDFFVYSLERTLDPIHLHLRLCCARSSNSMTGAASALAMGMPFLSASLSLLTIITARCAAPLEPFGAGGSGGGGGTATTDS